MGWDGTGWGWGWDVDGLTEDHDEQLVWRPANSWRKLLVRILRAKTMVSRQPGGRGKTMMSRRREFLVRIFGCEFVGADFSRDFF